MKRWGRFILVCLLMGAVTMYGVEKSGGLVSEEFAITDQTPALWGAMLLEVVFAWLWFCLLLGFRDLWRTAILGVHARRFRSRLHRGACQSCGYDLRSNQSGKCPECGAMSIVVKKSK